MLIGLCGKSGSGKSTLADKIVNKYGNAIHIDIDKVGHSVLKINEVIDELSNCFGEDIIENGVVNRKKLSMIVFSSFDAMDKLANITSKYMQIIIDKLIDDNKDKTIILDYILIPMFKYYYMCDVKILLDIPYEVRKYRAMSRDGISSDIFDLRDKNSISYNNNDFDYVIYNEYDFERVMKLI